MTLKVTIKKLQRGCIYVMARANVCVCLYQYFPLVFASTFVNSFLICVNIFLISVCVFTYKNVLIKSAYSESRWQAHSIGIVCMSWLVLMCVYIFVLMFTSCVCEFLCQYFLLVSAYLLVRRSYQTWCIESNGDKHTAFGIIRMSWLVLMCLCQYFLLVCVCV